MSTAAHAVPLAEPTDAVAMPVRRRRFPLHVHIAVLFIVLVLLTGAIIGVNNHMETRRLVSSAAADLFNGIGRETVARFESIYRPVEMMTDLMAHQGLGAATTLAERMRSVPYLADALRLNPSASALYAGYSDGDFFLLRPLPEEGAGREALGAPPAARFLVQSIERDAAGKRGGMFVYLDAGLAEIQRRDAPDYTFDPRTRGWYRAAVESSSQIKVPPYVFFTTREIGVTFARRSTTGAAVVGADLTLRDLSRELKSAKATPSTELVLFTPDGVALAYDKPDKLALDSAGDGAPRLAKVDDLGSGVLSALFARFRAGDLGEVALNVDGRDWSGIVARLPVTGAAQGVYLAMVSPDDELLGAARRISRETLFIALLTMLLSIPAAWLLSRLVANPLRVLAGEARSVQEFDFGPRAGKRSSVAEIDELGQSIVAMKVTIRNFLDIAATISAERNFDRLLQHVLEETIAAVGARAGLIYLRNDDGDRIEPMAAHGSRAAVTPTSLPSLDAGSMQHPVWIACAERKTVVAQLEASGEPFATFLDSIGQGAGERPRTVIIVPLSNRNAEVIGALCLFPQGTKGQLPKALVSFIEALSGTAAIAIENQALLKAQKALLESFIQLVAGAIDAKSPYTGGHCQRVPELTAMLAHAACDAKDGPFRDFELSDEQWEALRIASWLHDCGKVTTPEYVVDKATKLETLYDRLHEIRMRFEVLKRDAEIDYWRQVAEGGDRDSLRSQLDARVRMIDADYAFVAACNEGGEAMAPERIERLRDIAAQTWLRTLDDRIGLSNDERRRKATSDAVPLPAAESVLADKPEHVIERPLSGHDAPPEDLGIRMEAPVHAFNRGELHNLCVGRGTLTAEERYRINDHVVQTIAMLSRLPFPRHLRSVPEIAGGHHERIDGHGYPRQRGGEDLSVQARMLAIADIFEALTAADRPYKRGKTLSEAVAIMTSMCTERHIDAELFALFLTSGVYREYATRYLSGAQIDDVDVAAAIARAT